MSVYILTSTETIVEVSTRLQESHLGDPEAKGILKLQLKQNLTSSSFEEQEKYLSTAATAAYVSLNKLDQRQRFRASINLTPINSNSFNFIAGSSSSGLGYALAMFQAWWKVALHKTEDFNYPVFATGEILPSGQVNAIGHLTEKIAALCTYVENNRSSIDRFYFCYPESNDDEVSSNELNRIEELGGMICPVARLQDALGILLGDSYNGDPLGRWQPFKGLSSFNYEDSVRFFGRAKDIDRLYDDLQQNNGLLIVSGPSGAGKSSLIKAGLIPKLESNNKSFYWATTTPSDLINSSVLDFILEQLIVAWSLTSKEISLDVLKQAFEVSVDSGVSLLTANLTSESPRCLLYFDQYEEVFSQSDQTIESITLNLKLIDELAKKIENLDMVLALRNEYLGKLLDNQVFRSPIISNVTSQLSSQSWYDIVHEQAAFSGIVFEENEQGQTLDRIIIEEALITPYALPMVGFLLEQLHLYSITKGNDQKVLVFSDYEKLGGLSGAIAYRASEVLNNSRFSKKIEKLFSIFVGLNNQHLAFGKQVILADLEKDDSSLYALIQDLINANIIVTYRNSAQQAVAELAHDSLFHNWDTLKQWVVRHTDYLNWRYSIDGQYTQWTKNKNQKGGDSYLITDKRLLKEGRNHLELKAINEKDIDNYVTLSLLRLRKKRVFIVTTILLPLLIASLFFLDHLRIKSYYYSDIGERWGVPFGINRLSEEAVRHREFSYRLDYQGGVLIKLTHQNGFGTPTADPTRENAASWEYEYTDKNELLLAKAMNNVGSVIKITNYEFNGDTAIASFNHKFGKIKLNRISKNINLMSYSKGFPEKFLATNSDISRNIIEYDKSGFIKKIIFQNPYGANVSNELGSYGVSYFYHPDGRIASKYEVDFLGNKYISSSSPSIEYIYDEKEILKRKEVTTPSKVQSYEYSYDKWGNITKLRLADENKITIKVRSLDDLGNVRKEATYNEKGALAGQKFGVAVIESLYDNKGRMIVRSYFGQDSKPILNDNTHAKEVVSLDDRGNVVRQAYFGLDGEATVSVTGCEVLLVDFDKNNKPIKKNCNKLDGSPMLDGLGVAEQLLTYDQFGNNIQIKVYGVDSLPVINVLGFHSKSLKYDESGNVVGESYYDINGVSTPINVRQNAFSKDLVDEFPYDFFNGIASQSAKYDFKGNLVEETFNDAIGNPVSIDGVYKYKYKHDNLGRVIETTFLDLNDIPVMSTLMGYSKKVVVYDEYQQFIRSENYYDDKGELLFPFYDVDRKNIKKEKFGEFFVLDITSTPSDAKVFIDDEYVGNTPLIKELQLGKYKLEVVKLGYISEESTVTSDSLDQVSKIILLNKEPVFAFEDLLEKAKSGDSEAQREVGSSYLNGLKVDRNVTKAYEWYRKSALQSNPEAMYRLGYLYGQGIGIEKDSETSFSWVKKSADLGFSLAQDRVGKSYYYGWFGEVDMEMAYQYLLKSAKQGNANSAFLIASMYKDGIGIEKNIVKSTHWYSLAAQLGDEDAYFFIGYAYVEGEGVEQDVEKGIDWLIKASNSKNSFFSGNAYEYLALIYSNGMGVPVNYVKAVDYRKKALDAGFINNGYSLGLLIMQGRGTPVDVNEAIKFFKISKNHEIAGAESRKWLKRLGYYE